jgi:uncharacterized cupredoxin-like copper-binding protein
MITRATMMALAALALSGGLAFAGSDMAGHDHGRHAFAAGEPGDPRQPIARTVEIEMRENADATMAFSPGRIEVAEGKQLRFVLVNRGTADHELMLDTPRNNARHGAAMTGDPMMRHDDANGRRLAPGASTEVLWRFSKPGIFEYACLIPGHYESGMHGVVVVR